MIIVMVGILLLSVFTVFLSVDICDASGNTIYVDDSNTAGPWDGTQEHPYQHTQDAIDSAEDSGDTIYVYSGTYNENLVINKILTITGENKASTIISGATEGDVVTINANYVNISGFTIQNAVGNGYVCIVTNEVQNCKITNNIIKNTNYYGDGIYLKSSQGNVISENTIADNRANGIYLIASADNEIKSNIIQNNDVDGIYFYQGSSSNKIYQNTITGNLYYGIILISSDSNTIYLNDFSDNGGIKGNAKDQASNTNSWSYNSQGNYWDDYTGVDENPKDGIGDTPYNITTDGSVQDIYPLGYFAGQNYPPDTPDISGPETGTPGVTYSYTFETTDPNGDDVYYWVDWGDNSNSGWFGPYLSDTQASSSHGWSQQGTYTIEVKAKDNHEAESQSAARTLTVSLSGQQNQKPTAENVTINPNPATYGDAVSFYGQGSDNDGFITAYEWSEGSTTLSTLQSFSKSDLSVGTHIINFKVRDNGTVWSDKVSTTLVINQGSSPSDGSPTADAGGPYFGYANAPISFNGSGSTDNGTIVYYNWDFGDGTTIIEKSPMHIYTEAKNYTLTLTVTDDGGKTDTDTTYANVSMQSDGNGEKNKTPGFETIFVIISVTLILLWKRHKL